MTAPSTPLTDTEDVRADVAGLLDEHLAALGGELEGYGPDAAALLDALGTMIEGGKRLRPAFCYWSWRAHGGLEAAAHGTAADRRTVLGVGAALELFQAAALFHDDVMDGSDARRGRPAAHRHFEAVHRAAGWSGPADSFGEAAAILLGDLALVASERQLSTALATAPGTVGARARAVFDRMRSEVTVGQYLDVLAQALPWGDGHEEEARARAVVRAKSARYSVEHPMVLGAVLAGADQGAVDRCRSTGLALGEAFQLRDDVLGVFGDPAATGKPAGDDLREGKRTVLVARAVQQASPEDHALLTEHLGRRDLAVEDVERLRAVLHRSGALDAVETMIDDLAGPALDTLAGAPLAEPGRTMLVRLGQAAVDRPA
ncbi:polyprenyl synthetase [Actinotalea ferrariae CF5-4]|uniref:Polyprenyl synthetase n=1 Tax=Actinotalea ferrariae CF5-4 TaxID=948458 RepID=A0A021VVA0_9CELL|nr:polyprenyl synthetase family protein [Actinotalea ferrariae]EYR62992.1 polyprenyl synthetase [Actinotalea ferrariae CF5-4]